MDATRDEPPTERIDGRTAHAARRRAETQARILDAASRCFAERGYHQTSVDDIIGAAGVARGTFYLYFEAKRAVLAALLENVLEDIADAVRSIRLDGDESPRAQLLANLERVWTVFTRDRRLAQIVIGGLHGVDADFDAQVGELEEKVLTLVEASIVAGQQLGWLRACDARMAACALLGAFKENLADELLRGRTAPGGPARLSQMLEVLLLGAALDPLRDPGRR